LALAYGVASWFAYELFAGNRAGGITDALYDAWIEDLSDAISCASSASLAPLTR
jgi:hypothetical protein